MVVETLTKPYNLLELTTSFGSNNNELNKNIRITVNGYRVRFPIIKGIIKSPDMIETNDIVIQNIVKGIITEEMNEQEQVDANLFKHIINRQTPVGVDTFYITLWESNLPLENSLRYLNQVKYNLRNIRYANLTCLLNVDDEFDNEVFLKELYHRYKSLTNEYLPVYEYLNQEPTGLGRIIIETSLINNNYKNLHKWLDKGIPLIDIIGRL